MLEQMSAYLTKPALYAPGTDPLWDDEHISKEMLSAHLDPDWDAASRNHAFLDRSAAWIAGIAPPRAGRDLLDLGCGPGLYAERFARQGYAVVGVDFSRRSIAYAREQTALRGSGIAYHHQNYLTIDHEAAFDVVTLIYCDLGALPTADRANVLRRIHRALRPGGRFIVDAFTPLVQQGKPESTSWTYHAQGGFWYPGAYLCLDAFYRYDDDDTVLRQTVVLCGAEVRCYNVWEHCFTADTLLAEGRAAGFADAALYGDVAGAALLQASQTLCAVFVK